MDEYPNRKQHWCQQVNHHIFPHEGDDINDHKLYLSSTQEKLCDNVTGFQPSYHCEFKKTLSRNWIIDKSNNTRAKDYIIKTGAWEMGDYLKETYG